MNLLSIYNITQKGKNVEFTSDLVLVIYMHDNSIISIGEVDRNSSLYKFINFVDIESSFLPNKKLALKLQQIPKRAQFTLQVLGVLIGNPLDLRRTQSHHEEPSHVLSSSEPTMPMHCYMVQYSDPHTYSKVVGNPLWKEAMQKEYDSLLKNQTWDLVPLPLERNIFRCRWVHRIKRYKAR
jgi:hypothetical protein